ncbi:MAG: hypothetical protein II513_04340 [Ruminococcus sp.]|nr:hypothetical protein [Ruminococcus sp.]
MAYCRQRQIGGRSLCRQFVPQNGIMDKKEGGSVAEKEVNWAEIEADYVNSSINLREAAQKYGVPLGSVQKHSAKGNWSQKRKKYTAKTAEKVSEKLHGQEVNRTLREIERVCKAAGRLIDAANRAIGQLDKEAYVSYDRVEHTQTESSTDDASVVVTEKKRKLRMAQERTLVNTKRMTEIAKTLETIKSILTGEDGHAEQPEGGVIEIAAATVIDPREDENEDDLEAAAATGGDDGAV